MQIKGYFSTLARKKKAGKPIEPKEPKAKAPPKEKAPKKSAKKPASKKQRVEDVEEVPAEMVISEADRLQFEEEFADFDFGEPITDEDWLEQEAEMERLDAKEASADVTAFFNNFKKLNRQEQPTSENGCPIWVSFCSILLLLLYNIFSYGNHFIIIRLETLISAPLPTQFTSEERTAPMIPLY